MQFSNHTGYANKPTGDSLSAPQLQNLISGLESNNLLNSFSHILTGFIGSNDFLESVSKVFDRVQEKSPNVKYVCDPVLGDDGNFYVSEELVEGYKKIFPKAYMITPN